MVRMPCVAAVLNWRNENNKSGLYSVHIRVKIGNNARYYHVPIPQKIKKDQWSGKDNNWIKPTHPLLLRSTTRSSNVFDSLNQRSYTLTQTTWGNTRR